MKQLFYDRDKAVEYAIKYATTRNPKYYNFDKIGGNCTNYASQCLYAGLPIMNYSANGWYYNSISNRSPAWTDVNFFYDFLINNKSVGPYATKVDISLAEVGDFIQLKNQTRWYHTLVICDLLENDILVCANSIDSLLRPLSTYYFKELRVVKILGGKSY
ncbi:MAG: amidase domain-containing protein [Clostridia bacterium]|nr:amidase domain-containing protein [Clostridia bacterium]